MSEQHARNLTHQLVHDLGSAIVHGNYSSDMGLPSEAEICEQFSISRSATREAVKMLTAKGLLSSRPRQGIKVQPKDKWNLFDTDVLQWILSGTPTLETLRDFQQLRTAIEPEAASIAAVTADKEKIREIKGSLKRMLDAERGMDDVLDADISFHIAILTATNNLFYMQLRSFIETALRVSIRFTNQLKGSPADYGLHEAIYSAIADGNAEKAREMMHSIQNEALTLIESELNRCHKDSVISITS